MKVLIDGHMIGENEGGNERYTRNLFHHLSLLKNGSFKPILLDKERFTERIKHNIYRLVFNIPYIVKSQKIDIVHSNYVSPFIKNCKQVIMVHDLSFKIYPAFYNLKDKLIFNCLLPYSLRLADAIIVPSKYVEKEFAKQYPKYVDKLYVIPEGVDDNFYPIVKKTIRMSVNKVFKISRPFLLTINSKNAKKNINRVIKAFILLQKKFSKLKLVIVGGDFNISHQYKNLQNLRILNYVTDEQLNLLYNSATIFIYYSLYEGFGLPIIEALRCGALVVASDIEVHREISKDLLTYADPLNPKDLADKILFLLTHKNKAEKKRRKGLAVNGLYNWHKTARLTYEVYKKILLL